MLSQRSIGVDWTHPCFGGHLEVPNEKVVHAVSYTGEHPIDNFGHGTHVAGIIAADKSYKGTPRGDAQLDGLAPKAKLMGYKVLTAAGSGSATGIILAIEDAVKRGAHVLNLSLGDSEGDPSSPECVAANNAMMAGVIVCIAAGNSGPEASTIGAPGAAHNAITVGASTDDGVTALYATVDGAGIESRAIEMRMMEGSPALIAGGVRGEYVACGMGTKPEDFPAEVKGRIALIERGEVTFREKALGAEKAGAVAAVIYNNRDGNFFGSLGEEEGGPTIAVISISRVDGAMLNQIGYEKGVSKGRLRLDPTEVPQPDRLAEFSSRGPNNDLWIKPEIVAPGVNINSATVTSVPIPGGGMPDLSGYISASGTSMATPHVAGAAALLRQARPDLTAMQIKAVMVNTAVWVDQMGTVLDQGAGRLNLLAAANAKACLITAPDPGAPTHSFGLVVNENAEHKVTQVFRLVDLGAGEDLKYRLSVHMAGEPQGLRATLSAKKLIVPQGCAAHFEMDLTADGETLPEGGYFGWITAEADWGTLRLPFYYEAARKVSEQPGRPEKPAAERYNTPERDRGFDCC